MRKTLKILLPILIICIVGSVYYNLTKPTKINNFIASKIYKTPANKAFTDENFYKCVVDAYNSNNNASVAYTESLTDEQLSTITRLYCAKKEINNVDGLEKMVSLVNVTLTGNNIANADLSKNILIEELYLSNNELDTIDLSKNDKLKLLFLEKNKLTTLDVSKNTSLLGLYVANNKLTEIDLSNNSKLTKLYVDYNQLEELDLSNNQLLTNVWAFENQLTKLKINGLTNLIELNLRKNQLMEIDLSSNLSLAKLNVAGNKLTQVDISSESNLSELEIGGNQLTGLDIGNNPALVKLSVSQNKLTELDLSNNTLLSSLMSNSNELTKLDISNNSNLSSIEIHDNKLSEIVLGKNAMLKSLIAYNNSLTSIDLSNAVELTTLYLQNNKLSEMDLSKNVLLKSLLLENNELTTLDLSNNINLGSINICNNNFNKEIFAYTNDSVDLTKYLGAVKFPESIEPTLTISSNNSLITVENNITSVLAGHSQISYIYEHKSIIGQYKLTLNLYGIKVYSDNYKIDENEGYIYTGTDTDEETILSNISLTYGEASIEDNKLLIKYNGELIKSFDLVSVSSNKYDLNKDYIYSGKNILNLDDIEAINAEKVIENNQLLIKYSDELIKSFNLVNISSEEYDLTKEYIFDNNFNVDNIKIVNGTMKVVDNKLLIKYDDDLLQSYDIVSVNSNKYDLSKNYIYIGIGSLDLNDINVINGQKNIENNKLLIKYNDDLLKEYTIYNINFGEYEAYDGLLVLPEDIIYEEFTNNITTNGVTYKIFSEESEVTEGNISEGMIMKIYYGDEVIDEYEVTNEYLEFDESLIINNEVNIIEKLPRNLKLKDFVSLIRTSGSIEVRNNNNELLSDDSIIGTGSKLKIILSKRNIEYTLSVRGDVTGNGQAKMADVMKIATHIIEGNVISGNAFERAADITGDGKIKMNDVMKLATFIIDGGEL